MTLNTKVGDVWRTKDAGNVIIQAKIRGGWLGSLYYFPRDRNIKFIDRRAYVKSGSRWYRWPRRDILGPGVVIDNGWQVKKTVDSDAYFMGIKLKFDPEVIASFDDDEQTARAVCRDLNRSVK